MKTEKSVRLVEHGKFVANIPVTLLHDDTGWFPYLSHEHMLKLDDVRKVLRRGDVGAEARYGEVFELKKVA